MALGDLVVKDQNVMTGGGAHIFNVAAGTAILAGEPVYVIALGASAANVQPAPTSFPDASAHLMVGIAATSSTNTSSAAGTVDVTPVSTALTYLISPTTAATWDTQAEYNALVGSRVLIANSATVTATPGNSGSYTLGASDSTNNGCVVQPLDVFLTPGKVAIAFRGGCSYLS